MLQYDNSHLFYETGKPCVNGHISKRYKSTQQCFDCVKEHKQARKKIRILNKYNISEKEYDDLFIKQNFVCAICEEPETSIDGQTQETKILSVDHCHNSKIVRGLLCNNCNQGLGKFKDNPKLLISAAEYLKKSNPWLS